jgi:hypothetical protein
MLRVNLGQQRVTRHDPSHRFSHGVCRLVFQVCAVVVACEPMSGARSGWGAHLAVQVNRVSQRAGVVRCGWPPRRFARSGALPQRGEICALTPGGGVLFGGLRAAGGGERERSPPILAQRNLHRAEQRTRLLRDAVSALHARRTTGREGAGFAEWKAVPK